MKRYDMPTISFLEDLPLGRGVAHVAVTCCYGHSLERYR